MRLLLALGIIGLICLTLLALSTNAQIVTPPEEENVELLTQEQEDERRKLYFTYNDHLINQEFQQLLSTETQIEYCLTRGITKK